MLKMYLESIEWNGENEYSVIVFGNFEYDEKFELHVPSAVGFDLWVAFDLKKKGVYMPFGVNEVVSQIGGKFMKLFVGKDKDPGIIMVALEISGKQFEVELNVKDAVLIALFEELPVYFDENLRKQIKIPLAQRLLYTRTSGITNYYFYD
jgi:bifunctional DNase/RNase